MLKHSRLATLVAVAALTCAMSAQGQQPPAGGQGNAPRAAQGNGGNGGGGNGRGNVAPTQTDKYKSELVKLGDNLADGLLYQPVKLAANSHVAVITTYDVPAVEMANRGYRVLYVHHQNAPGEATGPTTGFQEVSKGIEYARRIAGVQKVVVAAWGGGAELMIFYVDAAERGPAACQGKDILYPCKSEDVAGIAKPDGVILLDPGLGSGTRAGEIDPAYDDSGKRRPDLDMFSAANGYDINTGTAKYSADFRKRYFAAQAALNDKIVNDAEARLKVLNQKGPDADEPLVFPKGYNGNGSLHHTDLDLLSHTKKPHTLLKADGSKPEVILHSIRPTTGPIGQAALDKVLSPSTARPGGQNGGSTVRRFLANEAVRMTDFAETEDNVIGVDYNSSNSGSVDQAEGIKVPTLVMTNTCFQFVVPSEMVYDHLSAKDKTYAGVEGSEHFFTPCGAQYGDTKQRLFDFVSDWLSKPGRF